MANVPKATPVVHPKFDFDGADVTLASQSGTLFRVYKSDLQAHSSFFRALFKHGASQNEPITVTETDDVLELLMDMCYPYEDQPPDYAATSDSLLLALYEAANKYGMRMAMFALRAVVQYAFLAHAPKVTQILPALSRSKIRFPRRGSHT
jgi:hypothetical protein